MRFLFSKKNNKLPDPNMNGANGNEKFCAVYAISETGPTRDHNEDSIAFSFPENDKKNLIAVVADGMGGHNAGEVASKMACQLVINYCIKNWAQQAPNTLLYKALLEANQGIAAAGNSNPEQQGMGTTASSVIIQQNVCFIGHIGDSRVYLLRNGELRQLSIDHTLVNKMFENGEISETERDNHPMKNVLLQALGTMPNIQPQIPTRSEEHTSELQ